MANPPNKQPPAQPAQPTNVTGVGRPALPPEADSEDPKVAARARAQFALDRACAAIVDADRTSYVARVAVAARAGAITKDQAVKGLKDGIQAAVAEAETAIARIFDNPSAPPVVKSRVSL